MRQLLAVEPKGGGQVATKEQTEAAITAVRNGQATRDQQRIAERAAGQAGSRGNSARDAFRNPKR